MLTLQSLRRKGVVAPKPELPGEAGPATTLCKIKQMRESLTTPTAPKDRCGPTRPKRWGNFSALEGNPRPFQDGEEVRCQRF